MKYLILLFLMIPIIAFGVAQFPPAGGWGHDCSDWTVYSVPWGPYETIYDPLFTGGDGFMVCPGCAPIVWPALDVQLWIEMECVFSFDRTSVDVHLASYYDDVCVTFNGTMSCNNGQWIIVNPPPGQLLTALPFVEDILGRTTGYGTDIPAIWTYSLDGAAFAPMIYSAPNYQFEVASCDHDFTIQLCLDIEYHQADGYYSWEAGGFLCPAEPL